MRNGVGKVPQEDMLGIGEEKESCGERARYVQSTCTTAAPVPKRTSHCARAFPVGWGRDEATWTDLINQFSGDKRAFVERVITVRGSTIKTVPPSVKFD